MSLVTLTDLYHSTLGLRVIKKKKKNTVARGGSFFLRPGLLVEVQLGKATRGGSSSSFSWGRAWCSRLPQENLETVTGKGIPLREGAPSSCVPYEAGSYLRLIDFVY